MTNFTWHCKSFEELQTSELYKILAARAEVFVIEQQCLYQDMDFDDQIALHLWGESKNEIAAYCRVFAPGLKYPEASIGRVLTGKNFRRIGLGKQLITRSIEVISTNFKTDNVCISAQDYLLQFYADFGFEPTGKSYLEDGIPHSEMKKGKA
ncbi:GNAT family N-acetyltransferase [Chryseobacterium sp. A301]